MYFPEGFPEWFLKQLIDRWIQQPMTKLWTLNFKENLRPNMKVFNADIKKKYILVKLSYSSGLENCEN